LRLVQLCRGWSLSLALGKRATTKKWPGWRLHFCCSRWGWLPGLVYSACGQILRLLDSSVVLMWKAGFKFAMLSVLAIPRIWVGEKRLQRCVCIEVMCLQCLPQYQLGQVWQHQLQSYHCRIDARVRELCTIGVIRSRAADVCAGGAGSAKAVASSARAAAAHVSAIAQGGLFLGPAVWPCFANDLLPPI